MRRLPTVILAAVLVPAPLWMAVAAQAPSGAPPESAARRAAVLAGPGPSAPDTLQHGPALAAFRRRLDDVRRRRMAEYLRLEGRQAADLERRLGEFRRRQVELRGERERLLVELRLGVEVEGAGRQALERRLQALRVNEDERRRALDWLREGLRQDLTIEQQARLHLFAERFGRQVAEGVRRIRDRRAGFGPPLLRPDPGERSLQSGPREPPGGPGAIPPQPPAR